MSETCSMDISVIIPVKNEADNIISLAREILSVFEAERIRWECVWVDDGSTDDTLALLRELSASDSRQRFISFEKNAGQSAAFVAGFRAARSDMIATIDGDGQNDPADLPALLRIVRSGEADMANGYRARRQDNLKRKIASKVANGFRNWMTGKTVRDIGCSTRVFRRECVMSLPLFAGMHRFLPTLVSLQGYRLAEMPVNHRPRMRGSSKYSINSRLWVGLLDTLGVFWLKNRAFHYKIGCRSETGMRLSTEPITAPTLSAR
ncbi:MAG: glycosyltransferase family 2 protein [Desulfobacteraceae bacterium]|nr:glycosyltransferase family 2 protein [Desulfobacteraceae bacterium]